MVFAHPDDEVIFGYPYLQRDDVELVLLTCSTNREARIVVLQRICSERNIELHTFESRSNFYTLNSIDGSLRNFYRNISSKIQSLQDNCDFIFTHNPHGEYGHPDHRIVFDIVSAYATKPVIYTDIHIDNFWWLLPMNPLYYSLQIGESKLDEEMYEKFKGHYTQKKVWTWLDHTSPSCKLFRIPRPTALGRYF